jgi:predicted permease
MVAAAAALVLLVACANVANLTLVRADAHQREIAVREALGAGRGRVILLFFAESALVSGGAAILGLAAAGAAVESLVSRGPAGIPRLAEVRIDTATVLFTLTVAAFAAVFSSFLPALRFSRGELAVRQGGRSATAGRSQHRVRGGLVAAQIALALVVLTGSGLLLRTFERLNAIHPGFDPANVSTFWISLPAGRQKTNTGVAGFHSRLIERVAALPGVEVVGSTSRLPLEAHGQNQNPLYPEDDPSWATKLPPLQLFTAVNGEYFRAMRIPLLAGRTFERTEAQREGETIVSNSTAEFFWKDKTGGAALGKRFRPLPNGPLYTVIGVVGDTRDTSLAAAASQVVYFPETLEEGASLSQSRRPMALVVRTKPAPRRSPRPCGRRCGSSIPPCRCSTRGRCPTS